ncbi:MAG: hypothetical protein KF901_29225 [Myxococcales bacterium]|nr:hypothetical protein [Myxococcales bacterium]
MRALGFVLFLAGLTVASWYAARKVDVTAGSGPDGQPTSMDRIGAWGEVAGLPFAAGFVLMIAGGLVARRGTSSAVDVVGRAEGQRQGRPGSQVSVMLDGIAERVDALDAGPLPEGAKALADEIAAILEEPVADFLEERERLVAALGLERFAELIGGFATMERGLARAWSALTDEAWEEVGPSLARAREGLAQARALVGPGAGE